MHTGLLDVFHHPADEHLSAVADGIDIAFDGVIQKAVEQHRRIVTHLHRFAHIAFEVALFVHDFHGAAAQHIAGTHHQRVADFLSLGQRFSFRARGAVGRLQQAELFDQVLKALAVFGHVDHVRAGADDGHAVGFKIECELERRLPAILHDHTRRPLLIDDFQHVFQRERLEIQSVGGVVIGRHRLRVAVDHDGFIAVGPHGQCRVHAAIVELDALADAVGPAAEHHDFFARGRRGFALFVVGRVEISRLRAELGRAGIDPLEHRPHLQRTAAVAHRRLGGVQQLGKAAIREALLLERVEMLAIELVEGEVALQLQLGLHDVLNLRQKPRVDAGELVHFVQAHALRERVADIPDALGAGLAQLLLQHLAVLRLFVHAIDAHFEPAQRLLETLLKRAAHGHHFADRLHLRGQTRVGLREFLEGEAWHLGDHVVDGRLERGRGDAAGDVVAQLVEGVTDRQLGGDLGDRKARGLGRQRRRPAHPRIHLDDDQPSVLGIHRELHIGAAGIDPDLAQHRDAGVAHDLVFLVGQGLRRGDGDRVAGVHAHRVEVFDRADDDAVVGAVAHHFHLELFPADQRFLDQQFAGGRRLDAALADGLEFLRVVGDAAPSSAQGEAGSDNDRKSNGLLHAPSLFEGMRNARTRRTQTDAGHGLLELLTVFGHVDGCGLGADQLHPVLAQHPVVVQIERAVQRGLPAHGRQDGVGPFFLDDGLDHLPGDGLDIGDIGRFRVGHNGRRIAVDQNDLVALFAQRLAGLGAGVVELAGLADDDGAGPDDQNAFNVAALGHGRVSLCG